MVLILGSISVERQGELAKNSISNLTVQVTNQVKEVQLQLNQAQTNLLLAANLSIQVSQLSIQLSNAATSLEDVVALSNRLHAVEESFREYQFPDDLAKSFDIYLRPYGSYLASIGFQIPTQRLEYRFTVKKGSEDDDFSYRGSPYKVVLGTLLYQNQEYRNDPDFIRAHYTFFVLDDGGVGTSTASIQSGIAHYLVASFLGNNKPYPMRDKAMNYFETSLHNTFAIVTDSTAPSFSSYTNAFALAGLFWDLRENAGSTVTDRVIKHCWDSFKADFPSGDETRGIRVFTRSVSSRLEDQAIDLVSVWKELARKRGLDY